MNSYIFTGLPKVLQDDYKKESHRDLSDAIWADIHKYGGVARYRDIVIMENYRPHSYEYQRASVRAYSNTFHTPEYWTEFEDVYVLKHMGKKSPVINRSELAIKWRVAYLRGRVKRYIKNGT